MLDLCSPETPSCSQPEHHPGCTHSAKAKYHPAQHTRLRVATTHLREVPDQHDETIRCRLRSGGLGCIHGAPYSNGPRDGIRVSRPHRDDSPRTMDAAPFRLLDDATIPDRRSLQPTRHYHDDYDDERGYNSGFSNGLISGHRVANLDSVPFPPPSEHGYHVQLQEPDFSLSDSAEQEFERLGRPTIPIGSGDQSALFVPSELVRSGAVSHSPRSNATPFTSQLPVVSGAAQPASLAPPLLLNGDALSVPQNSAHQPMEKTNEYQPQPSRTAESHSGLAPEIPDPVIDNTASPPATYQQTAQPIVRGLQLHEDDCHDSEMTSSAEELSLHPSASEYSAGTFVQGSGPSPASGHSWRYQGSPYDNNSPKRVHASKRHGHTDNLSVKVTRYPIDPSDQINTAEATEAEAIARSLLESFWFYTGMLELYVGFIGMQAVFVFSNFVFANYAAAVLGLFGLLAAIYSHIDRRPSSYVLTAVIYAAATIVLIIAVTSGIYGFLLYRTNATLTAISIGNIPLGFLFVGLNLFLAFHQTASPRSLRRSMGLNAKTQPALPWDAQSRVAPEVLLEDKRGRAVLPPKSPPVARRGWVKSVKRKWANNGGGKQANRPRV